MSTSFFHAVNTDWQKFLKFRCMGRLTTESGVAVSTADRTSQATVYWTPYLGNAVALYNGSRWINYEYNEISIDVSPLTSDYNYDVFLVGGDTSVQYVAYSWTNDTTRAQSLTYLHGIPVMANDYKNRYVGTFRTSGSGVTEDSGTKRYIWNYYNRRMRGGTITEGTDHTYATASWREYGAGTYRFSGVWGISEGPINISAYCQAYSETINKYYFIGVGENSTTSSLSLGLITSATASIAYGQNTSLNKTPVDGYNYYTLLENASSGITFTADYLKASAFWES